MWLRRVRCGCAERATGRYGNATGVRGAKETCRLRCASGSRTRARPATAGHAAALAAHLPGVQASRARGATGDARGALRGLCSACTRYSTRGAIALTATTSGTDTGMSPALTRCAAAFTSTSATTAAGTSRRTLNARMHQISSAAGMHAAVNSPNPTARANSYSAERVVAKGVPVR